MFEKNVCAHEPCSCKLDVEASFEADDGPRFRSPESTEGEGCVCLNCGCGLQAGIDVMPGAPSPL